MLFNLFDLVQALHLNLEDYYDIQPTSTIGEKSSWHPKFNDRKGQVKLSTEFTSWQLENKVKAHYIDSKDLIKIYETQEI